MRDIRLKYIVTSADHVVSRHRWYLGALFSCFMHAEMLPEPHIERSGEFHARMLEKRFAQTEAEARRRRRLRAVTPTESFGSNGAA